MRDREGVGVASRKAARSAGRSAQLLNARSWALTLVIAAGLGLLLAVATTSLPYLVSSPTTDPHFGALNHCLTEALRGPRLGWAVAPDASRAAIFDAQAVAVCGPQGRPTVSVLAGVTAVTFDGTGRLWVATGERLLREEAGQLRVLGELGAVALAGQGEGVLALDSKGELVSISPAGEVLAQVALPAGGTLSVGPGGELAVVLAEGGLWAFEARTLTPLAVQAPCPVEGLWWLAEPGRILVLCGATGEAFTLDLKGGGRAPAFRPPQPPARLLLGRALYVQGCEGLPCTASPP
ncbi:hypothetical protein POL68_31220 [Stigmatella sp. ncwal1]|uniref:Uncharacterized protein n=1 Tax=Stigmatella ashevillensis TaxID=2995309 RepID=A0ABT5DIR8_9BACT|nr:hypothetical protein [Stigmatella ashevillena]MDC0712974.1 hypothetical protein [Stigmatella ashevillena]